MDEKKNPDSQNVYCSKRKVALTQKESKPKIYKWKGKNKRVS
jgi:hypothetical protein